MHATTRASLAPTAWIGKAQHGSGRRTADRWRRYLSAVKTLVLVRKLALPVLQVNIAKKQVNVAGPAAVVDAGKGM